jgi:hypothetical protein
MPSYESSMRNLAKAGAKMRPPRPWRSSDESRMIRRYVFLWYTGAGKSRPVEIGRGNSASATHGSRNSFVSLKRTRAKCTENNGALVIHHSHNSPAHGNTLSG